MTVHICRAERTLALCGLNTMFCPTCETERGFAVFHYAWYGGNIYCLHCGDGWNEDGRMPRPFERAWRKKRLKDIRVRVDELFALL